jgi:hypothetical protein
MLQITATVHLVVFYAMIILIVNYKKEEVKYRMKKTVSSTALAKEAAFWDKMKTVSRTNPGLVCRK